MTCGSYCLNSTTGSHAYTVLLTVACPTVCDNMLMVSSTYATEFLADFYTIQVILYLIHLQNQPSKSTQLNLVTSQKKTCQTQYKNGLGCVHNSPFSKCSQFVRRSAPVFTYSRPASPVRNGPSLFMLRPAFLDAYSRSHQPFETANLPNQWHTGLGHCQVSVVFV